MDTSLVLYSLLASEMMPPPAPSPKSYHMLISMFTLNDGFVSLRKGDTYQNFLPFWVTGRCPSHERNSTMLRRVAWSMFINVLLLVYIDLFLYTRGLNQTTILLDVEVWVVAVVTVALNDCSTVLQELDDVDDGVTSALVAYTVITLSHCLYELCV